MNSYTLVITRKVAKKRYSQSIAKREESFSSLDLDAVLVSFEAGALADAFGRHPRCEFRRTPAPNQWEITNQSLVEPITADIEIAKGGEKHMNWYESDRCRYMYIDVRRNSRFSRLCPSHVLRLRGRLMMPVDSLFGGFLVARVVFGSLSALAFRVVVER